MSSFFTPILANGTIMIVVEMMWSRLAIGSGILALLGFVLAVSCRAGKGLRWLAVISLIVSLAPLLFLFVLLDLLDRYGALASFGPSGAPLYALLSFLPLALSAVAVWLTRRSPPVR